MDWNSICDDMVELKSSFSLLFLSFVNRSDEGLTLETSAFLPFTVANLRFQPSCLH